MTAPDRYGQRKVPKMIREWDAHRQACRAEGTPAIQETLDAMEEHIDYAYRAKPAAMTPEVRALVEAAEKYLAAREPYDDEDDVVAAAGLGLKDALAALRAGGDA